ncbi:MAG: hypothetical protein ACXADY_24990 [Candidatus Hodarchaeales archaeon]
MAVKISINLVDSLIFEIERVLSSEFENRQKTLPVKVIKRNNNTAVTWNIYPTDTIKHDELLVELIKTIEDNFNNIIGEIIKFNITNGSIIDSGNQEFQIIEGQSWEVYLFDPETFIYIRLLNESRIADPLDKWLSIDIDIVEHSAWFAD